MKIRLIDEWKGSLRFASMALSAFGAASMFAWVALPPSMVEALPSDAQGIVAGLTFLSVMVARLIKQGPDEEDES